MKAKMVLLACAATVGLAMASGAASAMPNGMTGIKSDSSAEQVRWVCNPWGRCWRQPNYYGAYGYYGGGPRFYGPRWGGRRGWRRW
jgi:hypothetical protein